MISGHRGYEMSYKLKVTALKMLMIGRAKEIYEQWEEEFKGDNEDDWKILLVKVQDYATRKRLEANHLKGKNDPMDVNHLGSGNNDTEWGN